MKTNLKEFYEAPSTMVFEVKTEGVICDSPIPLYDPIDYVDGGNPFEF